MILLKTSRNGYEPEQCGNTFTVEELIDILSDYDPDEKVYFSNDNGYTYGSISEENIDFNE